MNHSPRYINVTDTIEINGIYLEEHRRNCERRNTFKLQHYNMRYERRLGKPRRHCLKVDIDIII